LLQIACFSFGVDPRAIPRYNHSVFLSPLALALSVLSPTLPISSAVTDATVEVCFSPEDDCDGFAERAIEGAGREILAVPIG
jgi:hypothetical protein